MDTVGNGVASLLSWLGTTRLVDCCNRVLTVILGYIDLFQFLVELLAGPGPYQAHPWLRH